MFSRMSKKWNPHMQLVGIEISTTSMEKCGGSSKLKVELPYDSAFSFIGIYPKECKSGYNKASCTSLFTAALFTTAKIWKQPRCLNTDKWIKNCGIYT
jgi:hypothetical protein